MAVKSRDVQIKLDAYQEQITESVVRDLQNNGRALMVMATGTGKTYTSFKILRKFLAEQEKVLFLAHTHEICDMLAENITQEFGQEPIVPHKSGWRGTSQFYVVPYQTVYSLMEKNTFPLDRFSYAIIDEAHHTKAPRYELVLEQLAPSCTWMLGMTATPNRMDNADIRDIFGSESVTLDIATAITEGILTPATVKIRSRQISEEELAQLQADMYNNRISRNEVERRVFSRNATPDECAMIQEECGQEQALVFCGSLPHAQEVKSHLPRAEIISYENPHNERTLTRFRYGEIQYLISINKLNEGVDLPFVKYGISLRSTQSSTIIWQQLGRILRVHEAKDQAVFVDFVGNMEKIRELEDLEEKVREAYQRLHDSEDDSRLMEDDISVAFDWDNRVLSLYEILSGHESAEPYPTLEEARNGWFDLVNTFGVANSLRSFFKNYHKDPQLRSWRTTKKLYNIRTWNEFLGLQERADPYPTLEEARNGWFDLVNTFGVANSLRSFCKNYHKDPQLRSWEVTQKMYGTQSWNEFLGLQEREKEEPYPTLEEARKGWFDLVNTFGVANSLRSFCKNYHKDPQLRSWRTIKKLYNIRTWKQFLGDE